jgi:hypothetical protein
MVNVPLLRRRLKSTSIRELTRAVHALTGATAVRIVGDELYAEGHTRLTDDQVVEVLRLVIASEIGADDAAWATKPRLAAAGLI